MAKTRRSRDVEYEEEWDDQETEPRGRKAKPRRSWLSWFVSRLFILAVLLGLLALFAPNIIAGTRVWKYLLAWSAPELAGKVEIGSLSLAWWAPIELKNISLRDEQGQPLSDIPQVRSRKLLWQIAADTSDLGVFEVTEPKAKVVLRKDGSNIEDFLAKLPKPKDKTKGAGATFGLVLTRGAVTLEDTVASRSWALENVDLDLVWPASNSEPKTGKLSAAIRPLSVTAATPQPQAPTAGQLAAEFSWQPGAGDKPAMGAGHADVKIAGLPTEIAEGALYRFVADIRPQGPLTLDAAYDWSDDGKGQHLIVRQLAAPQLSVMSPELLGDDVLQAAVASGKADLQISGGNLTVKSLALESNLVGLSGQGAAPLNMLTTEGLVHSLSQPGGGPDIEISGQIDLAELARQLPQTLRLKEGTEVTSGVVGVSLASRSAASDRRWVGSLKTNQIRALARGRQIQFDQSITISFAVRQTPQGPVIDELSGQASFLDLRGEGSLSQGTISAGADLNRLADELGRIIDWGDTQLAGTLAAEIGWNRGQNDQWHANANARVQRFGVAASGLAPWSEDDLRITADVDGVVSLGAIREITAAKLTVSSGADRLEATLTGPVANPSLASAWPAQFVLQGDLATWSPRLQPVVPLGQWRIAGAIDAQGGGQFSPARADVTQAKINIEQLAIEGPSLIIVEPVVKLNTAGDWDQAKRTLSLPSTTLESSSIAFRADAVQLDLSTEPVITGLIDFRGDLEKLSAWLPPPAGVTRRPWLLAGSATGRVEIGYRGNVVQATWMTDVDQFAYLAPVASATNVPLATVSANQPVWETRFSEPRISVSGQATYDPAAGKLSIARSSLVSSCFSMGAAGTLSELTTRCTADLKGEIAYDLEVITQRLKEKLAPAADGKQRSIDTLQLVGQEKRPFTIQGPLLGSTVLTPAGTTASTANTAYPGLVSDQLIAEASLGWQGAHYVGLVAGPADVRAKLEQGVVHLGPIDIPVSEGRLTTAPRILLNDRIPALVVDRGPLINNVRITPEMCHQWLKYVAPLVADATRAEGKFSVGLAGAAVPVFEPKKCDVAGTLSIDAAQIGPGPLAQQYLGIARQVRTLFDPKIGEGTADPNRGWVILPKQDVQFEVLDGAVHHRGLVMTVGDVSLTTQGSVGIDSQEINLVASVPVQDDWFKKDKQGLLASLRGQTIQIPIRGTLSKPKADTDLLKDLGKQIAGSALQGILDKQLKKGQGILSEQQGKLLEGIFGPKPKPAQPGAGQ